MKIIDRIVTQDGNDHWRLREIMSKLRGQIALHDDDPEMNLDKMTQLIHEIEFDFGDYTFIQEDLDTLLEAHNIIKENNGRQ